MRSGAVDNSLNTNWMINHFSFSRVYTGSDEMADYVKGNWGKAMLELRLAKVCRTDGCPAGFNAFEFSQAALKFDSPICEAPSFANVVGFSRLETPGDKYRVPSGGGWCAKLVEFWLGKRGELVIALAVPAFRTITFCCVGGAAQTRAHRRVARK